jgi:Zn-dependent protease with chaperone function/tetratricopeptide (TPR) repeat protein
VSLTTGRSPLAVIALAAGLLIVQPALALQNPSQPDPSPSPAAIQRPESAMERQGRDLDRRLTGEVEKSDPEAARLFMQANEARDREDHSTAYELYGQVYDRVPSFVHALRRQCNEELALGHREMAVALCRNAVRQKESADNLAALARALMTGTPNFPSRPPDQIEALGLATRAAGMEPGNVFVSTVECQVAIQRNDSTILDDCIRRLQNRAPDEAVTHFFQMIQAANAGRYDEAIRHLEKVHDAGLIADEAYREQLKILRGGRFSLSHVALLVLPAGGIWLGVLAALLVAGLVLSRVALRAAAQVPSPDEGPVTGMDARLRRVYRAVLLLCCGYYYLSIPIVALLVVAAGGGTIYAFFRMGQIPIKLVFIVGAITLYTLSAMARSLFVRGVDQDPGERLDLDTHSRLKTLLDEVAQRVGTRTVDNVYMTPGAQVAVMERGRSMLARARGRAERCLILGAAALEGMRLGPFKAILAHEYGHFSNRDTAGGGFALAVRRSLLTMGQGIARGGAAAWYNPAWLFVIGFYRVFLRISQGASRLQEVLADRWAALSYGSPVFEEGLRHVVARAVRFEAHADATLNEVIKTKRPLENLYMYKPERPPIATGLEESVKEALEAKASPYDSHPSPEHRIAWVHAMNASGTGASSRDGDNAWSLFPDREAIERAMTAVIRQNVARVHGVSIAGAAQPSKT